MREHRDSIPEGAGRAGQPSHIFHVDVLAPRDLPSSDSGDGGDRVSPTDNCSGDDDAPEERVRRRWDEVGAALQRAIVLEQRWDEVADALEGANVLQQLAELARVPEETRVEFCRQVSNLVSDMWTYDADRRALVVAKQNKSLSRAIDALRAARQALADLDEELRKAARELIVDIELGMTQFLACMREESGPARRRAHRRGRRPGTVKNRVFAAFVVKLRREVKAAGGRLGLQKNLEKGTLLEAIDILAPHLPDGFVPQPLSVSTLQRIIKSG